MSGRSKIVGRDPYDIYITEPAEFTFDKATCDGAPTAASTRDGGLVKVTCRSATSREIA